MPRNAKSGRSPDCSTAVGSVQVCAAVRWRAGPARARGSGRRRRRTSRARACPARRRRSARRWRCSRLGNELVRAPAIPSNEIERTPSNCPTSVTSAMTRGLSEARAAVERARQLEHGLLLDRVLPDRRRPCPWLSVATAQPWRPPASALVVRRSSASSACENVFAAVGRAADGDRAPDRWAAGS